MKLIICLTALFAAACNPNPQTPSTPDADCDASVPDTVKKCPPCVCSSDAGPVTIIDAGSIELRACANLASLGCSDGTASDCVATLEKVEVAGKFRIDVAALVSAKTIAAARTAGAACK